MNDRDLYPVLSIVGPLMTALGVGAAVTGSLVLAGLGLMLLGGTLVFISITALMAGR